jgi:hypothetical protein
MVSIKEAAENALAFARESLGPERTQGARLEEVESTRFVDEDAWLVTLSMIIQDEEIGNLNALNTLFNRKREYKTFTVRKSDGEVTSMKIRELADA